MAIDVPWPTSMVLLFFRHFFDGLIFHYRLFPMCSITFTLYSGDIIDSNSLCVTLLLLSEEKSDASPFKSSRRNST